MEEAKKLIIKAVRELKKEQCKCDNCTTCVRCIAIVKLNSIHNFLSENQKSFSKEEVQLPLLFLILCLHFFINDV